MQSPQQENFRAIVIRAHQATDSAQLKLDVDDIVYVLEQDETGWWGGHKENEDTTGWFPGSCVRVEPFDALATSSVLEEEDIFCFDVDQARLPPTIASDFWDVDHAFSIGSNVGKHEGDVIQRLDVSQYSSTTRAVEALNAGTAICASGICIVYSSSHCQYFLLVRSDKAEEGMKLAREVFNADIENRFHVCDERLGDDSGIDAVAPKTPLSDGPRLQDHVAVDLEGNPWKFEDTYNLGATDIKADDATIDRLDVSRFSSVSLSLEALNSGAVSCSRGLCITYSSSQQCYYLLVRSDKTVEGSAMAQRFGIDAKKASQEQPPPTAEATPTEVPGEDVANQEQQPFAAEATPAAEALRDDAVSPEEQPTTVEPTATQALGEDVASQEQQRPTAEATPTKALAEDVASQEQQPATAETTPAEGGADDGGGSPKDISSLRPSPILISGKEEGPRSVHSPSGSFFENMVKEKLKQELPSGMLDGIELLKPLLTTTYACISPTTSLKHPLILTAGMIAKQIDRERRYETPPTSCTAFCAPATLCDAAHFSKFASVAASDHWSCVPGVLPKDIHYISQNEGNARDCMDLFIVTDTMTDKFVLCVRSSSTVDYSFNMHVDETSSFFGDAAHAALLTQALSMAELAKPIIDGLLAETPNRDIAVVGHGVAAGVSILLALELFGGPDGLLAKGAANCYAFGSPPLFSSPDALPQYASAAIFSFVNNMDCVPRVNSRSLAKLALAVAAVDNLPMYPSERMCFLTKRGSTDHIIPDCCDVPEWLEGSCDGLFHVGTTIILVADNNSATLRAEVFTRDLADRIILDARMVSDHEMQEYERALCRLVASCDRSESTGEEIAR